MTADITTDRITPEERVRRLTEGLTLKGRWYFKIREHLYTAGGVWDQATGSYLMPDKATYDDFLIPEREEGDVVVPCGRFAGWPIRLVSSEYLAWMVGPGCTVPWSGRVLAEAKAVLKARAEAERELARQAAEDKRRRDALAFLKRRQPDPAREEEDRLLKQWGPVWDSLPAEKRAAIEEEVATANPNATTLPSYFRTQCVRELARRMS